MSSVISLFYFQIFFSFSLSKTKFLQQLIQLEPWTLGQEHRSYLFYLCTPPQCIWNETTKMNYCIYTQISGRKYDNLSMCLTVFKGLRHINNYKSNIHFLILVCKSLAVKCSLMSWNHQTSLQFPSCCVFSKWNPWSIWLRSDYWLGHWRREEEDLYWSHFGEICITLLSIPLVCPKLFTQYVSGHCLSALWSSAWWILKPLAWMRADNIDWNTLEVKNIVSISQYLWSWPCNEWSQKLFRSWKTTSRLMQNKNFKFKKKK